MELRQLKYFVAAADLLNFTKAADSLFIAQPTLSQQIAALETDLGVQLFAREKNKVSLTPSGKRILPFAKRILSHADALKEQIAVDDQHSFQYDAFSVGISRNVRHDRMFLQFLSTRVGEMLGEGILRSRHFDFIDPSDLLSVLSERDIVFTMECTPFVHSRCNTRVLFQQELRLFFWAPNPLPDTTETVRRLFQQYPLYWLSDNQIGLRQLITIFADLNICPSIRFQNDSLTLDLMLGAREPGLFIFPSTAKRDFPDPCVRTFSLGNASLSLYALWRKDDPHPAIPGLLDRLAASYQAEGSSGDGPVDSP